MGTLHDAAKRGAAIVSINPLKERGLQRFQDPQSPLEMATNSATRIGKERDYVVPEDLFELSEDVVLHRIRLSYEALAEGRRPEKVLEELLHQLG